MILIDVSQRYQVFAFWNNNMQKERVFYNDNKNLKLVIAEDDFAAYLTIFETGKPILESDITLLLERAQIKKGFDRATTYLRQNHIEKKLNEPFLIALGKKTTPRYDLHFHQDRKNWFKESFRLEQLATFPAIEKDDPIATVTIKNKTSDWIDVFGNKKKPNAIQDISQLLGDQVYWNHTTSQICASVCGYPYLNESNRISIKTEIVLKEDLIDSTVECHADLICIGAIKNCQIIGRKKIKCAQPIENSLLFSGSNLSILSAKHSLILCRKDFTFNAPLEHCSTFVQNHIFGSGKSHVIGGKMQAGESIILAQAGSAQKEQTHLEVTYLPVIKFLLTSYYREHYRLFFSSIEPLFANIDLHQHYKQTIAESLRRDHSDQTIKIFKAIYPNTYLRVLSQSYLCRNYQESISL